MEIKRPDPEELLNKLEQDKLRKECGRLKIFFGYAAGVGKTYSMLKAARALKETGVDVILGYIEPHSRPDTMELVDGLEVICPREFEYHGIRLKEMDLDGILNRNPEVVLVDELAHTDAYDSRHKKRYQDVEELINAGIDVYTTVNVQHIESLCDIVASITGIFVRERIPDSVFDHADEVQMVDVEPSELLQRLKEGKIYCRKQADRAMNNFFTEEKLAALREIALRRMADRVNRISEKEKRRNGSEYFTEEKLLVGLSPSPSNPKIIRTASRLAQAFGGILTALYVETSISERMKPEDKARLKDNMHLAEQLGAEIVTICGEDIPFLIAEYARTSGISKIVTGRNNTRKGLFGKKSFTDKLTILAPNVDIYIIPDSNPSNIYQSKYFKHSERMSLKNIGKTVGIFLASTLLGFAFFLMGFSDTNIITVYLLGVMATAILTTNRLLTFVQTIASIAMFNYCFTEPRFSLQTYDAGYPVTFVITSVAALFASSLALKMKLQQRELAKTAYRTRLLLDINQLLQDEQNLDGIGRIMAMQLSKILDKTIVYYKRDDRHLGCPVVYDSQGEVSGKEYLTRESERAVAEWVFKNNKRAGSGTNTLGSASCYYLAIRNQNEVLGVTGIELDSKQKESLAPYENNVIFAILSETAMAMEKEILRST